MIEERCEIVEMATYDPKSYDSEEEDEIINELTLDDELDGAAGVGLTLNGE